MNTSTNTLGLNTPKVVRDPQKGTILRKFAHKHRLKTSLDNCGELVVIGRQGQIYEYSDTLLGVMFVPNEPHPRRWGHFRRLARKTGLRLVQEGDSEGAFVFDPDEPEHAKLAIRIAKVRKRRRNTEARREQLRGYLVTARKVPFRSPLSGAR
jgi:hypothetical protein